MKKQLRVREQRLRKIREISRETIPFLCAIEREFNTNRILIGGEVIAIVAQVITLRIMLQKLSKDFGKPNVLLPKILFADDE